MSIFLCHLGKQSAMKETEIITKEATRSMEVKFSVQDNTKRRSPTPDKKETKKTNVRRPLSMPPPKQDSVVTDPKILRRPPSARQSMAMSVAHIGLPDDQSGMV